ncbi:MAG: phosphatase PAP2 family protein [Stellaceae bacterium]
MRGAAYYTGALGCAIVLFLFVPQLDIATSRLFYASGHGFLLADWPPVLFLYGLVPWLTCSILAVVAMAAAWLFLLNRPLWRLDRNVLIFIVASLALGPGLLANIVLKDHWGRARPTQIEAFGGPRQFTAAPLPASECPRNCAFVSGHAAIGFSLVAFAFPISRGRLRHAAIAGALGIGGVVGLGRMAQGAHFLSDIVFAGLLVYGTTALLYWWIVERDGLEAPPLRRFYQCLGQVALAGWSFGYRAFQAKMVRFVLVVTAATLLIATSIDVFDRPVARFFHARDPDLHALFELTGRLGLTYGYLTLFGLAFVALHWGGLLPRLRPVAAPSRAFSAIPAFLFLSIAAAGLVADVLKLILGRTRPKLLFANSTYDFAWLGLRPDHWSFPSGHSATIFALVTALWWLWPQHALFYVLIASIIALSRVVVGAHYLSDVFAGALIGVLTTWGLALLFAKSGFDLAAARRGAAPIGDALPWPCRRFGPPLRSEYSPIGRETGSVAHDDPEECNIAPRRSCDFRIDLSSWPCASKPSTTSAAETPSIKR